VKSRGVWTRSIDVGSACMDIRQSPKTDVGLLVLSFNQIKTHFCLSSYILSSRRKTVKCFMSFKYFVKLIQAICPNYICEIAVFRRDIGHQLALSRAFYVISLWTNIL